MKLWMCGRGSGGMPPCCYFPSLGKQLLAFQNILTHRSAPGPCIGTIYTVFTTSITFVSPVVTFEEELSCCHGKGISACMRLLLISSRTSPPGFTTRLVCRCVLKRFCMGSPRPKAGTSTVSVKTCKALLCLKTGTDDANRVW